MPSVKKVARRIGLGLLITLGSVVAIAGLTVGFLSTPWGGNLVLDKALPRINAQIAGKLTVDRFRFGGNSVALWGVTLRDPEGKTVATVGRIRVGAMLMALLRKKVTLTEVAIDDP